MSNSRVRHLSPEKTSSILKCPSCTLQFRVNSSNDLAKFKVGLGPKRIASKDPKILNCGHVLCQICLEKWSTQPKVQCPTCYDETPTADVNIKDIPTSFFVCGKIVAEDGAAKSLQNGAGEDEVKSIEIKPDMNCSIHPGEAANLRCSKCLQPDNICERCLLDGHYGHPYDIVGNSCIEKKQDFMQKLSAVKYDEKEKVKRRLQKHYMTLHNKLQLDEIKKLREIEAIYLDLNGSIDESWRLDTTLTQECQEEILQKVWADVKFPSLFTDLNSTTLSKDNEGMLEISRPKIRFRYEFSNIHALKKIPLKNVTLATKTDERVVIVKVRSPEDFVVHRAQDEKSILQMMETIKQKLRNNELTAVDAKKGLQAGDKVLIPPRKKNIRFQEETQASNDYSLQRGQVMDFTLNAKVTVHILDYGTIENYDMNKTVIYYGDEEIFNDDKYPVFAVHCRLFNVKPAPIGELEMEWSETAGFQLQSLKDHMIFAKVMDDAEGEWKAMDQGTILVDLYMKQSHDPGIYSYVSDHLVFMGNTAFQAQSKHPSGSREKLQYVDIEPATLCEASHHVVQLGAFEQAMQTLRFKIRWSSSNETNYDQKLRDLTKTMTAFYSKNVSLAEFKMVLPRIGQVCAIQHNKDWFRGQIVDKAPGKPAAMDENGLEKSKILEPKHPKVQVQLVDEGGKLWVSLEQVRLLRKDFIADIPKMTVLATLAHVKAEDTAESLKFFSELCQSVHDSDKRGRALVMSVDKRVENEPLKVVLYDEREHKRINLNALLVWKDFAVLFDENQPFCQRVEYFKDDSSKMVRDRLLPVYSESNVSDDIEYLATLTSCSLANVILENGCVVVFLNFDPFCEKTDLYDLNRDMSGVYERTDVFFEEEEVLRSMGQLCAVKVNGKYTRCRIYEVDGNEVISVINIDTGTITSLSEHDLILPLFSEFQMNLDHGIFPFQIAHIEADNEVEVKNAIYRLVNKDRQVFMTRASQGFQLECSLARADLQRFDTLPEIDLVAQICTDVEAFTKGEVYHYDLGRLLCELGITRKKEDLLPLTAGRGRTKTSLMTMTVKPRWLDPVLPSEAEYRKLRLVANNTTIRDFDAKITCVDNNGHFWVQRLDQLGALTSVESQIEAVYLLTKRKFQDDTWYINEPCIAQFYHDKRWYRGLIKAINDTDDSVDVLFIDYGNPVKMQKDQLRKDLIGMDLPRVAIDLTLDGVEFTDNFDPDEVHAHFFDKRVHIELKESPADQYNCKSLRAKIHLVEEKEDVATLLIKRDIVRKV